MVLQPSSWSLGYGTSKCEHVILLVTSRRIKTSVKALDISVQFVLVLGEKRSLRSQNNGSTDGDSGADEVAASDVRLSSPWSSHRKVA